MALELSNNQYDSLMRQYQRIRFDAEETLRQNKITAYKNIPELGMLDKEIIQAMRSKNKENIKAVSESLDKKKQEILMQHGYPSDFLTLKYICEDCKDTGFIDNVHCHCFKTMAIRMIYGNHMQNTLFEKENFDTFDFSYYRDEESKESAINALSRAKQFVNDVINPSGDSHKNLIIMGNTGVGKTFLCNCIAKELIEHEKFVLYLSAPRLFELYERMTFLKNNHKENISPEIAGLNGKNISDCDLLIIDDLGSEFQTTFTVATILDVINQRLHTGPTLISTNLSLEGIKSSYTERFLSRLVENYTFVNLTGKDIRFIKRDTID